GALLSSAVLPEGAGGGSTWIMTGIAGGGAAGLVQGATVIARGLSSVTTGGLANPIVSTAESIGAVLTSLLAMVAPLIALLILVASLILFFRWRSRKNQQRTAAPD
ncbi:MAG: DUF4126 domain-containing protein, partial [Myxococcota bacterium]